MVDSLFTRLAQMPAQAQGDLFDAQTALFGPGGHQHIIYLIMEINESGSVIRQDAANQGVFESSARYETKLSEAEAAALRQQRAHLLTEREQLVLEWE